MKLVSLLSRLSLASTAALAIALCLGFQVTAAFLCSALLLFSLVIARDYSPRTRSSLPRRVPIHKNSRPRAANSYRLAA